MVNESEKIKVKPRGEDKEIMKGKREVSEVIQIRLEEIAEKVLEQIDNQGINLSAINAGIVLTGGSSKLAGIKEFFERYTDLPVRIGSPTGVIGLRERVQDPAYATAVGLLKLKPHFVHGYSLNWNSESLGGENKIKLGSLLEKIKSFFKEVL
jgi:cell division protein FtsA